MTTYLLDTHALIWWWLQDPALSAAARYVIEDDDALVMVSAVSAFEIGQKVRADKLPALQPIIVDFVGALAADGFGVLSLEPTHALQAGLMPGDHRDPFDRLIAAQGLGQNLTIVTRDREIAAFGCRTLW